MKPSPTTAATSELVYADASALVKLVVDEPESGALERFVDESVLGLASCAISVVEVLRAVRVADLGRNGAGRARELLGGVTLVDVDAELLESAVPYTSAPVRTLDALHLASALRLDARRMLVYDRRLAEAAQAIGLETLAPGA